MRVEDYRAMRARVRGGVDRHARKSLTAPVLRHGPSTSKGVDPIDRARIGEAGSNPAPSPYAPYRNKLEHSFAGKLALEQQAGFIRQWGYENMTFKLSVAAPGKRGDYHRNDFVVWHLDGHIEMAQTKGWHKNLAASLKSLRWAAQKHPWFTWTIWRYIGGGWQQEQVQR